MVLSLLSASGHTFPLLVLLPLLSLFLLLRGLLAQLPASTTSETVRRSPLGSDDIQPRRAQVVKAGRP